MARKISVSTRVLGRVVAVALSALLSCVLGGVGVLLFWSYPGKPKPFVDATGAPLAGSIAEKVFVDINGVRQGMIIESKDVTGPVLLYLHGGMPDYFLSKRYPTGLEDLFTVVWWEQRGAGISYDPAIPQASLTSEQFIADTLAVTDYLRRRFSQAKIYLMGHSGGPSLASRPPPGPGAVSRVHRRRSDGQPARVGDAGLRVHAWPVPTNGGQRDGAQARSRTRHPHAVRPPGYLAVRDEGMHRLGVGTMHEMTDFMRGLFVGSFRAREYTLGEKVSLWRGKFSAGVSALWSEVITTDLAEQVPALDLPVYFLHGSYDYTVSYPLAKAYFERLRAPVKGFYTFEQSAHSPMFEEPEKTLRILREDVLRGTNSLADAAKEHVVDESHDATGIGNAASSMLLAEVNAP